MTSAIEYEPVQIPLSLSGAGQTHILAYPVTDAPSVANACEVLGNRWPFSEDFASVSSDELRDMALNRRQLVAASGILEALDEICWPQQDVESVAVSRLGAFAFKKGSLIATVSPDDFVVFRRSAAQILFSDVYFELFGRDVTIGY